VILLSRTMYSIRAKNICILAIDKEELCFSYEGSGMNYAFLVFFCRDA
jgi:hypothetical protein